jgi:hypothetical protein
MIESSFGGDVFELFYTKNGPDTEERWTRLADLDTDQGLISLDERYTNNYPRGSRRITLHLGVGQDILSEEAGDYFDKFTTTGLVQRITKNVRMPSDRINDCR